MKCGACKRDCRSTQLAHVAEPDGGMRRARVCGTCFNAALHIVTAITTVQKGVDETKVQRRDAADATKAASKKLRAISAAYSAQATTAPSDQTQHAEGRAAGLEQAADILDSGDY